MKKWIMICCVLLVSLLSGCMYPDSKIAQNSVPYKDQLQAVQSAVNQFREANGGLLPIKTKEMDTPIYQKYLVDFTKLAPHYMAEPPGNAFESGGIYQYVLVDPETNPTVKLIDLRVTEVIRDLKLRIQMYRDKNQYPPFEKELAAGVYTLNYKELGYQEEPHAVSPYSGENLPLVIDGKAEIYIDYRVDLYQAVKKYSNEAKEGKDIRPLLLKDAPFVPAYSLPYTVKNGEPVFMAQ
ncbi:hypothetical protein [Ectobacillus ponti]|uniref:ABC transporter periplasmic binding protein yphF n=1 Tax=Ectobacillus ponti TaxID=2961894 RepID=A0AA41X8P5_9BACI|nr:hypothetical protein [Ectobacillus ponti]MCP8968749.1 hypothetical protein [Ectobacillus ponti]